MHHDPSGPQVVLSPHPDDAVLSTWSLLRSPGEVVAITVCAGVPPDGHLGRFDPIFGATDSAALVRERRAEDAAALALAGRAPIHLDHLDDQYRDAPLDEAAIAADIDAAMTDALASGGVAVLWAPAGIGRHPDHLAVRSVGVALAEAAGVPLRLYADLPYAANFGWPPWVTGAAPDPRLVPDAAWAATLGEVGGGGVELVPHVVALDDEQRAAKLAALRTYASQFPALDGGPVGRLRNPAVLGFELWWSVVHAELPG